jgi:hypothetical protein
MGPNLLLIPSDPSREQFPDLGTLPSGYSSLGFHEQWMDKELPKSVDVVRRIHGQQSNAILVTVGWAISDRSAKRQTKHI